MKWKELAKRNADIVAARIASPGSNAEIARHFGLSQSVVGRILKDYGVGTPAQYKNADRDAEIIRRFKAGFTLQEVGDAFGITRERVRQILGKRAGLVGKHGGKTKRSADRRAINSAKRRERYISEHGMTEEQYKLVPDSLKLAFKYQRRSAKYRGISWEMNLREWLKIWEDSGVIHLRGRGKCGYCMSRRGDSGPYSPENARIISIVENGREYQAAKRSGERKATKTVSTGVYYALPGYSKPFQAFARGRCVGFFATATEAIAARKLSQAHAETPAASAPSAP